VLVPDSDKKWTENDCRYEIGERDGVWKYDRRRLEAHIDMVESRATEPLISRFDRRKLPRVFPVFEKPDELVRLLQIVGAAMNSGEVWTAAALGVKSPATLQNSVKLCEEPVVIQDPVKGRGAEHDVERSGKGQCRDIGEHHGRAWDEWRKGFGRDAGHILRAVHGNDFAFRKAIGQQAGQATAAASGIHHTLVAGEREGRQNTLPPIKLRL